MLVVLKMQAEHAFLLPNNSCQYAGIMNCYMYIHVIMLTCMWNTLKVALCSLILHNEFCRSLRKVTINIACCGIFKVASLYTIIKIHVHVYINITNAPSMMSNPWFWIKEGFLGTSVRCFPDTNVQLASTFKKSGGGDLNSTYSTKE